MSFECTYLLSVTKVTTDKSLYNHGDTVGVFVEYSTFAQQTYKGTFVVSIIDSLGVTVGHAVVQMQFGGATQFDVAKTSTFAASIVLPSWAFAGIASVAVDCFNALPAQGGVAITPEKSTTIIIQPT